MNNVKQVNRIEQKQSAGKQQVVGTSYIPDDIYHFRLKAGEEIASEKVYLSNLD